MVRRKNTSRRIDTSSSSKTVSAKSAETVNSSNAANSANASKQNKTRRKSNVAVHYMETQTKLTMTRKLYKTIKLLQLSTNTLIAKAPFARLVREIILQNTNNRDIRIKHAALRALQEACEYYMVQFFEDSYLCTLQANRKTLFPKDMQLARRLRGREDIINR